MVSDVGGRSVDCLIRTSVCIQLFTCTRTLSMHYKRDARSAGIVLSLGAGRCLVELQRHEAEGKGEPLIGRRRDENNEKW